MEPVVQEYLLIFGTCRPWDLSFGAFLARLRECQAHTVAREGVAGCQTRFFALPVQSLLVGVSLQADLCAGGVPYGASSSTHCWLDPT